MIRLTALLLALPLLTPAAARAAEEEPPPPPDAWVARVDEALLPGDTMLARARIATRDGMGGESVDVLDVARASYGGTMRTLIEVEAPAEGKGVVYEIVDRPGAPLERWVWLPSVRRLRRVSGVQRTDPFLGSEFTYEDLGLAVPVERGEGGSARWVEIDGDRLWEFESEPYHYYRRVVTRVDPRTRLPRTVLFYDQANQLYREQRFDGVREVGGHPFPTRIAIHNVLTGASSVLTFDSIRFDVEIPLERFSESEVRKRVTAAEELIEDEELVPDEG